MPEDVKEKQLAEIASVQIDPRWTFGGEDFILRSTDPILSKQLANRLKGYRDLLRDGKVTACFERRVDMTTNAPMLIKPGLRRGAAERARDRRNRDMVEAHVEAMGVAVDSATMEFAHAKFPTGFDGMTRGLLLAIMLGYSVGEIMWAQDGREVYPAEVRIRRAERFRFDKAHRLRLLTDADRFRGVLLPHRKFLPFTFNSFTDPYGLSLGYQLYWLVFFKRQNLTFWLRMLDKYGGGTILLKFPPTTPKHGENSQETLLAAGEAMQTDSVVSIPDTMDAELLQAVVTAAQQGFDQLAKFLDAQIAQTMLGVTLTTELASSSGSRAATESHSGLEREIGRKDANALMEFLTCTLSRWIIDFNDAVTSPAPRFIKLFPDIDGLIKLAGMDSTLRQSGFKRSLESVNQTYAHGEETYEEAEPQQQTGDEDVMPEEERRDVGAQLEMLAGMHETFGSQQKANIYRLIAHALAA